MSPQSELVDKLTTLNHIAETLNQAVDARSVLDHALADLVELMGLESGWIILKNSVEQSDVEGDGFTLAAHHNLPPALAPDNEQAWTGSCTCRELCALGSQAQAYNEVHCSRLARAGGERRGLAVHASAPLRSGDRTLGMLNVAAPDWESFSPEALSLLTNAGSQIGMALERARLYDLLQERHAQEQAALLHFSNQLLRRRALDELMGYLVKEARKMLRADACALLLPDDKRGSLEFRASDGWRQDPVAARREVPSNGSSGPGLVMRTQQPLLAQDLWTHDPTPWAPAWLQAEEFRSHTVVPLLAERRSIGALVVNRRRPHLLPEEDLRLLRLMANQAAMAIEKARLHEEEVKMQALEKELAIGRQIQLSLLPKALPNVPGWEFAIFYEAAREVGGDFYDAFDLPGEPDRLGLLIADVTGKGVPAALFMARSSTLIRSAALQADNPSTALAQANDSILKDRPAELLLTALYAALDPQSGRLVYANGGHCRPLWVQAGTGQVRELTSPGMILGAFTGVQLEEREITMEPGDLLLLFTDGVTEAMDADGQFFDDSRLMATLAAHAEASAQELVDAVVGAVRAFAGGTAQADDLALLVVRRLPLSA